MTIITHDIIAVCFTVIRNNSAISNKIFRVCENRNWHVTYRPGAKRTKEIIKYLNSVHVEDNPERRHHHHRRCREGKMSLAKVEVQEIFV